MPQLHSDSPKAPRTPPVVLPQVGGELVADLREGRPHWAVLVEQNASRFRNDSLLASDPRIMHSGWQEGCQVCFC